MPLLHQPVTRSFRLDRKAIEHARLADCEIANVDHLLHFAFAFGDNFSGLERDELAELVFQFAQCVAKTANSVAAHRTRSRAPFQERVLSTRNRLVVIVIRCGTHTCDSPSINRRNLVDLCSATAPFAIEDTIVYVGKTELFESRFHKIERLLHIFRSDDSVNRFLCNPVVCIAYGSCALASLSKHFGACEFFSLLNGLDIESDNDRARFCGAIHSSNM